MDKERWIGKYENIINLMVSPIESRFREDIKQDLYMLVWKILNSNIIPDDIDSYIFIALKNRRNILLKNPIYQTSISLNVKPNEESENEILDMIIDQKQNSDITNFRMDLERIMKSSLTPFAGQVIRDYFFQNLKEREISEKHNVTQQYISKILRKAIKEIQSAFKKQGE